MTSPLSFVLNGRREVPDGAGPTDTLLGYLRAGRTRRLTGTKEGCAEGDCGSCTVLLGARDDDAPHGIRYRLANACILLMPMVHGRAIVTVEALKGPAGELHPCQQSIVDTHGSQCGFCTPGFVMALRALQSGDHGAGPAATATDALAGNLCRCTGYGPLIDAADAVRDAPLPDWDIARQAEERALLDVIAAEGADTIEVAAGDRRALVPQTADAFAAAVTANPDARIVAGATDVGLWVTKQDRDLPTTIYLGHVAAFGETTARDGKLRIGASVTYADIHARLADLWPDLGELIRRIGGPQVRASGTICGNIANGSPIGDMPPALIALGAELILRMGDARRRMPLEDFFLQYGKQDLAAGEFVEAVEIPLETPPGQLACYKISKRFESDISAVLAAVNVTAEGKRITGARIAFGGMAGVPKRARAVERALRGEPFTVATFVGAARHIADDFAPLDDLRGSAGYRLATARNLLIKYGLERTGDTSATRLTGLDAAVA
ncbi:MAG: xanthine dehydrogenase small subunit [Pseudomonadota bacterium]